MVEQIRGFGTVGALSETNQAVGQTLGILQVLEDAAVYYLVLKVRASLGMGSAEGDQLIQKARKSTFGQTISALRDGSILDEDLDSTFRTILDERNWLVHKSLNSRYQALEGDEHLAKFLVRLDNIRALAMALLTRLIDEAERFVIESGIEPADIASEVEAVLSSWTD